MPTNYWKLENKEVYFSPMRKNWTDFLPMKLQLQPLMLKRQDNLGKYLLALQNTTQQPLLQNLKTERPEKKLFKASWTRAEKGDANDTRSTIEQLAKLRLKESTDFR